MSARHGFMLIVVEMLLTLYAMWLR